MDIFLFMVIFYVSITLGVTFLIIIILFLSKQVVLQDFLFNCITLHLHVVSHGTNEQISNPSIIFNLHSFIKKLYPVYTEQEHTALSIISYFLPLLFGYKILRYCKVAELVLAFGLAEANQTTLRNRTNRYTSK